MKDLRNYAADRLGLEWRDEDQIFLVSHLDKIDKLAQDAFNARSSTGALESCDWRSVVGASKSVTRFPLRVKLPVKKQEVYP